MVHVCMYIYNILVYIKPEAGTSENVTVRMKKNVLSWFGHVERMTDERMAKRFMVEKCAVREVGGDLG